jgi:Holliday junction resolvase RusA-like endonuclease
MTDFVVVGIPRTPQTKKSKSRDDWKSQVAAAARLAAGEKFVPITEALSATVVYFHRDETELDVDGIGKLLLDSLEGIFFNDDCQIEQVLLRKTQQIGLTLTNPPPVLAAHIGSEDNFVYVRLGPKPDHQEIPT